MTARELAEHAAYYREEDRAREEANKRHKTESSVSSMITRSSKPKPAVRRGKRR